MEQDELQRQGSGGESREPASPVRDPEPSAVGIAPVAEPATVAGPATVAEPAAVVLTPPPASASLPAVAPSPARRRFLRYLLGFSIVSTMALVITPVIAFLVPPKAGSTGGGGKVSAGTVDDIPLGQAKVVPMGSKPTIVINTEQGVMAFSAICTHLGCIVAFDDGNGTIVCPCHDGRFNATTGAVISGPPPGPLEPVAVSVEEGEIFLVDA